MASFSAYVAGTVWRPGFSFRADAFYTKLEATAKQYDVQLRLPIFSERLDGMAAKTFAEEIRGLIGKSDATIVVIARPSSPEDLSGYSIAVEAQEAALAGKPIALFAEEANLPLPRLLQAIERVKGYNPETSDRMFKNLAEEVERRRE